MHKDRQRMNVFNDDDRMAIEMVESKSKKRIERMNERMRGMDRNGKV